MIGWTNPSALWALAIGALPVIIHLLRRHHAERVPFPSLRFVPAAESSAVRLRRPSDPWLLLLRVAALALAVCAIAGPIVLTRSRVSGWNAAIARAIVVDTSESMRTADADGALPATLADEAAQAEARTAAHSARIDTANLDEGMRRGAAWAASAPPARREIVIVTDAQRGAVDDLALRAVPASIGLRFVGVGRRPESRAIDGPQLLAQPDRTRRQTIELTRQSTAVAIEAGTAPHGLRIIDSTSPAGSSARLLDVAARAGSIAPSAEQPIAVRFDGGGGGDTLKLSAVRPGWMLTTVLGVMSDPSVASIAATDAATLGDDFGRSPWTVVVERGGKPVVSAAAATGDSTGELVLQLAGAHDTLFAAAVVRAALNARRQPSTFNEDEIAQIPGQALTAWQRPAAPVDRDAWRRAPTTDARWCWLLALAALIIEQWVRSRSRTSRGREDVRAAA